MSKSVLTLVLISFATALVTPFGFHGGYRTLASAAVPFETTVSQISDPDPRDDTSIAVSLKNDQIIVGTSKVILGGGTLPQGNSRAAYYFSSDGGVTWGSGLIALET